MSVTWHRKRWWNWSLSEDKEKGVEPIVTENVYLYIFVFICKLYMKTWYNSEIFLNSSDFFMCDFFCL